MNCKGCWNYENCEKKNNPKLYYCFRKNESLCHYCIKENLCKEVSNTMMICTEFKEEV